MIRMINGSTRIGTNIFNAASGPFEADEATEKRLVSLSVAAYATKTPQTPAERPAPAAQSGAAGNDTPQAENGAAGQETPEGGAAYGDMKAQALRNLMKERGLPCKVGIKNAEMIAALEAYDKEQSTTEASTDEADGGEDGEDEAPVEDGELPPDLGSEDIVV